MLKWKEQRVKLEEKESEGIIQDIKNQKIAGCNVTVPFKKAVIPYLDKLSPVSDNQSILALINTDEKISKRYNFQDNILI